MEELRRQWARVAAGSVTLYHGTLSEYVPSIQVEGLRPPPGMGFQAGWFMLTTSFEQAAAYARGDAPAVIEFEIPRSKIWSSGNTDALLWPGQEHNAYVEGATAYALRQVLPPSYITRVHRLDGRVASLGSNLYWRTHPTDRKFSPDDATSKPFYGDGAAQRGYSCFASPWHLWLYLDAMRWYESAKTQDIIGFSGERVGTGNDGEDLVVPDMRTVKRISFAEFERELLTTPMPSTPKFGPGWEGYGSWKSFARTLRNSGWEMGDDPLTDMVLRRAEASKTAMPSWRGLMHGPVWAQHPGVVLVDKGGMGRQTYEVYVDGEIVGRAQRLDEAKAMVEEHLGPCTWRRDKQEPIKTEHYYFGPQTWFGDPSIVYVAEPRILSGVG